MFNDEALKRHEIETAILTPGWHFILGTVGADVAQKMQADGEVEVDPFSNRPGVYVRSPQKQPQ